jgi:hypothetical protein
MAKTKVVPLRIPENLDELAALSAREEHTDKATALRQWLYEGAAHYVLKLVSDGRISMSRGAELLAVSMYDLYNLAERHAIEIGASDEQRRRSRELALRLGDSPTTFLLANRTDDRQPRTDD